METSSNNDLSVTRFIIQSIRPFPWQLAGLIFVACYWALHVSLQPYVIKLILDRVSVEASISNLMFPVIFYIALSLAFTLNFRFYDYVYLNLLPQLKANIIADATKAISHQSYTFFQNQFAGGIADKIKNLSKGTSQMIGIIFDRFFSHCLALVIACLTLMLVHPLFSLLLFTWTLLLIVVSLFASKRGRQLSHEYSESSSRQVGTIVDRFTNILNVRLFAAHRYEDEKLEEVLRDTIQRDKRLRWYLLKLMSIQGISTAAMISGSLLLLIFFVQSERITVGDFGLVLTLTLSFAEIMWHFAQEISNFSEVYGMVSQGVELLKQHTAITDAPNATELQITKGEIRFLSVHFNYGEAEPLFSNKSITILPGQRVGLVGYSGSGKSTFVNLILRLFEINSGQILIDNQNINQITLDSLHQSIGMIPQDPTLFHRDLMENIRYGRLESTDEQVVLASKKAHAHEFIAALPQGYKTLVGERGIKLSGGQRQRIAIARAILKNAPILLMDEATSALDSVTESLIKESLITLMEGKTTLVIAHRLSTLLHMDRILVFEQGKIVEDGSHLELLSQAGLYKKLWAAQVGGFIPDEKKLD